MALGADRGRIMRLVMTRGLVLAVAGLVLGMAGAAAATRVLGSLLFNVTPGDPSTLVIVGGLMLVVAAAACFVRPGARDEGGPVGGDERNVTIEGPRVPRVRRFEGSRSDEPSDLRTLEPLDPHHHSPLSACTR
jgi:hypothetical protein